MQNMMQWKTIILYKQYDVNYMHVGILYANVFTELCSINETSAYRTRALLRLERTVNLLEGGKGGEGRVEERVGRGGEGRGGEGRGREGRDDGYIYCNRYVH